MNMHRLPAPQPLSGWQVVVLRPAATRAPLVRALRAAGASVLMLPALRLAPAADADTAARELASALAADATLFTSPAAVRFARNLPGWRIPASAIAIGSGTAAALHRAGIAHVEMPDPRHETSEGVLALPALATVRGRCIGLVTAPGGRSLLEPALTERGALIRRADVYRRLPGRLTARHRVLLATLGQPSALLLSSADALRHLLASLTPEEAKPLRQAITVASSERLAAAAHELGFRTAPVAASARSSALASALIAHAEAC